MDNTKIRKENKMGTMPVAKLLINMSLPIMFSMFIQALYNIVDSIFVARIGENAMTSVTLSFPVITIIIAMAVGTGTGINTLMSQSLGEKNYKLVNSTAENAIFIYSVYSVLFILFSIFMVPSFLKSQTDNIEIIKGATSYLRICSFFAFITMYQIMFERFFQATGFAFYSMLMQASGSIINIVLDPIFIFGYFGCPKMGIKGAAYATVLGQLFAVILSYIVHKKKNNEIEINVKNIFKPKLTVISRILLVGIPSALMMAIGSLMTYFMNLILISYSITATAFFGIYFRLQSFFFMPIFGMNNGLIPIIAYNYGACKKKRILDALKISMISAVLIMLLGTMIFHIFPEEMLDLFNASDNMKSFGIKALGVISLSFPFAAVGLTTSAINQAFSKSSYSLIISVSRQLVVLIPVAYFFSKTGNIDLIWWSFPIAELASFVLSILFFRYIYIKRIKNLHE